MSANANRKEAIKEYKSHAPERGIVAVRCAATGRVWVESSLNVGAVQNKNWFMLRHGHHRNTRLQAAWNEHGEASFACETLETLDEDVPALLAPDLLKKRRQHWIEQLGAQAL